MSRYTAYQQVYGMQDCIHLHACRKVQKIARAEGYNFARNCNEHCSCYVSRDGGSYITVDEAIQYARRGACSIRGGSDSYDVYCTCDLYGQTIGEIIDEAEQGSE